MPLNQTRRGFLRTTGAAAGAAMVGVTVAQFLSACRDATEAQLEGRAFQTLSDDEAVELEAFAACIVPTTDTPGAVEAGAVYFIDNILGGSRSDLLEPTRAGLADMAARARALDNSAEKFSDLDAETQIAILTEIEQTDFFYQTRLLTMAGVLADPSHGGNRDRIGWDLIGFEGHFASAPPFGYYDANYEGHEAHEGPGNQADQPHHGGETDG